jgi:hypothetical protein
MTNRELEEIKEQALYDYMEKAKAPWNDYSQVLQPDRVAYEILANAARDEWKRVCIDALARFNKGCA